MNRQQLVTWLTDHLKQAEPLDRPSALDDPREIAITATKKLALLGVGDGNLYRQALAVESPQDCAAVLMDCLSAISESSQPESPQPVRMPDSSAGREATVAQGVLSECLAALATRPPRDPEPGALTPPQVASHYGVSPDTVRRWIRDGLLEAVNVGEGTRPQYRITPDALRAFEARRPGQVVVPPTVQRRTQRREDLPFTRYS